MSKTKEPPTDVMGPNGLPIGLDISKSTNETYFEGVRTEMLPYVPTDAKRILEVGCGSGHFAAMLKEQRGVEAWGIEYNEPAAETARERLDRVFCGDVAALIGQLPDDYFDVIIFNDVLEHLVDPYRVLNDLKPKLVRNGRIVTSIPNIRYYKALMEIVFKKEFKYREYGIFDKTHLRFFTEKSIRRMFEDLGYTMERLDGINGTTAPLFNLANLLLLGGIADTRHLQFACVASKR